MRPETKAFLRRVRDAESPSRADEERVLRALRSSVAAGLTSTVAVPSWGAHPLLTKSTALGTVGGKLSVFALCAASALGSADSPGASTPAAPPPSRSAAPSATVPAISTAAPAPPSSVAAPAVGRAIAARSPRSPALQRATTLRSELELLDSVQAALKRGDARAALRALDAHRTIDRRLAAERDAARIFSLCMLGRTTEARSAAAEFTRRHPESLHGEAIGKSCANAQRNEAD